MALPAGKGETGYCLVQQKPPSSQSLPTGEDTQVPSPFESLSKIDQKVKETIFHLGPIGPQPSSELSSEPKTRLSRSKKVMDDYIIEEDEDGEETEPEERGKAKKTKRKAAAATKVNISTSKKGKAKEASEEEDSDKSVQQPKRNAVAAKSRTSVSGKGKDKAATEDDEELMDDKETDSDEGIQDMQSKRQTVRKARGPI